MKESRKNELSIKYIFTFRRAKIQPRDESEVFIYRGIDLDEFVSGYEIWPKEWELAIRHARTFPEPGPWEKIWPLKLVDKNETSAHTVKKYTFFVHFKPQYENDVLEFLNYWKFREIYHITDRR